MHIDKNIVVFWIDEAPREDVLQRLSHAGMQVYTADSYEGGIEWLSNPNNRAICDAVLLDVNCKTRPTDAHETPASFRDNAYRVINLCESGKRYIPWFVFTSAEGYDTSLLQAIPQREWTKQSYYNKETDQQRLVDDIRLLTKETDNIALRQRYEGIFNLCMDEMMSIRLRDILEKMESGEHNTDTTLFNAIRKLMAYTVVYGRSHGLFSEDVDGIRAAYKRLAQLRELEPQTVPSYIVNNYFALVDTVNNGSHSTPEDTECGSLAVDEDVLSGNAPYLTRVAVYQLLTILNWLRTLPTEKEQIEAFRKRMNALLSNPIAWYEGRECYLECDESGTWHYGQCAIRVRPGFEVNEKTLVRLQRVQVNINPNTKKHYPYYALYFVISKPETV